MKVIYWGHRPRKRKTMQRSKCIRYKREKDTKKKKRRRKKNKGKGNCTKETPIEMSGV